MFLLSLVLRILHRLSVGPAFIVFSEPIGSQGWSPMYLLQEKVHFPPNQSKPPIRLGPPVVPLYPLFWGRVPLLKSTKPKKVGSLILTSQISFHLVRQEGVHFPKPIQPPTRGCFCFTRRRTPGGTPALRLFPLGSRRRTKPGHCSLYLTGPQGPEARRHGKFCWVGPRWLRFQKTERAFFFTQLD